MSWKTVLLSVTLTILLGVPLLSLAQRQPPSRRWGGGHHAADHDLGAGPAGPRGGPRSLRPADRAASP